MAREKRNHLALDSKESFVVTFGSACVWQCIRIESARDARWDLFRTPQRVLYFREIARALVFYLT